MVTRLIGLWAGLLLALGAAQASQITVDFDDLGATSSAPLTDNLEIDGFRFSPDCHLDISTNRMAMTSTGIGWDRSGCATDNNPDYLGGHTGQGNALGGNLYIDHAGSLFSLLSMRQLANDFGTYGGTFYSSKGGSLVVRSPGSSVYGQLWDYAFSGDEWRDIEWLVVLNGGGGPTFFLDSITFGTVPEPSSALLVALACAVLLMQARRGAVSRLVTPHTRA